MELQALTGQLYIVDGVPQEETAVPGLLALPAPAKAARGRERDYLFVHLTLTGPLSATAELTQRLALQISRQFYQSSGSITSALRSAIMGINQALLKRNLTTKEAVHEGAITCAVMRGTELYVVQVGESLALLGHNFGVERLPARAPERLTPLGRSAGLDFRYFHQRLQPGDMLLLADPRIAHLPSDTLSSVLVDTEIELALDELETLVGTDTARLLMVEFLDDSPYSLPNVTQPMVRQGRITLGRGTPQSDVEAGLPPETQAVRPPVRATGPSTDDSAYEYDYDDGVPTSVELTVRHAASRSALGLSRFTGWLAAMLGRLRPPHDEDEDQFEPSNWTFAAIVAIVIPVLVAVMVTSVYLQRGRVQRVAVLKQNMVQSMALASETGGDEAAARQHYNEVLAFAEEAETLRPGDEAVLSMRNEALLALDRLDEVTPLSAAVFHAYDEGAGLTAVTLREGFDGDLYVLDGASSTVYLHETDESYTFTDGPDPTPIFIGGQAIGSHVVSALADMFWRPSGTAVGRSGIAALDKSGALITYHPDMNDQQVAPLGLASEWQDPVAVSDFAERLYVLDPPAATIWKYFPEGDGFNVSEGERTLELGADADLNQAVDFDIYSEDGSVVVAYGDGRVRYYDTRTGNVQWDESTLLENGLNGPLEAPSAVTLVGRGLNSSIFLLDGGNGRILQISRGGTVLAQYRAMDAASRDVFTGATDLAVAETPLRVFVTVGNTLYLATQQ